MTLEEKINAGIKEAMKSKDKIRLDALRAIKSQILLAKTAGGSKTEISDEEVLKILQKMVKQRKESAQLYREKGRDDLAEEEINQAKIIEELLPEQVSEEELEKEIKNIIEQTGASSIRDMGKVMGVATKKFAGRADNKLIAEITKKLLNS